MNDLTDEDLAWLAPQIELIGSVPAAPPPPAHPATVALGVLGWLLDALAATVKSVGTAFRGFHPVAQVLIVFAVLFGLIFEAGFHA